MEQKIFAGNESDHFGEAVFIDGDRAIIGAPDDSRVPFDADLQAAGAAYIFERNGSGTWVLDDTLFASDADSFDEFGATVCISGDRAIVGTILEFQNGAAYVFERQGPGNWREVDILTASDGVTTDRFGQAVCIDGDTDHCRRKRVCREQTYRAKPMSTRVTPEATGATKRSWNLTTPRASLVTPWVSLATPPLSALSKMATMIRAQPTSLTA